MDSIIILIYVYMFLIGMCVASFMNVVIERVPRNESFVKGRSHCDHCGETLKWYDLIPIVSYIFLRGKCRYCHTSIPIRGFLIEIFGGLIGMFCFYRFGFEYETILMFVIAMILLAITMIDFDTMIIPDGLNIAMFIVSIVLMYVRHMSLLESIMGMFCISVPMILLNVLIAESFGGGDIKLMFLFGIVIGYPLCICDIFLATFIAFPVAVYTLFSRKDNLIPFGPFLAMAAILIHISKVDISEILNFFSK